MLAKVNDAAGPVETNRRRWSARDIFVGAEGLRVGWGCALFVLIAVGLMFTFRIVAADWLARLDSADGSRTASHLALDRSLQWLAALIATWFMSRIEKRPLSAYGFATKGFVRLYLQGAVAGFACLSLLLLMLLVLGAWRIDGMNLHGPAAWGYGFAWSGAFALAAFSEETQMRGYLLAALSRGIRRWPAAVALSLLFGALHLGNGGENRIGILSAVIAGIVFSYAIWRTGSLAFAFGMHAAWNWGESFFYGTPDSGQHVYGYLFASHASGNRFVSGGSAGPEGSLLAIPVFVLMGVMANWARRDLNGTIDAGKNFGVAD
jgi:CAAX protease family protein